MMQLAYFSPLPPARSGLADYSQDLLPGLARGATITLFTADPAATAPALRRQFEVAPLTAFPGRRWAFDLSLYQMGNNAQHAPIWPLLRRYPGCITLHDYNLHQAMSHLGYGRELGYALGAAGAWRLRYGPDAPAWQQLPLNNRLLDGALGLIVHSHYVADLIQHSHPHQPTAVIPLPMPLVDTAGAPRPSLPGLPSDATILACLGQITPNRQLALSLRVFSRLQADYPTCHYVIVGETVGVDVAALRAALPAAAAARVHHLGFVPDLAHFLSWVAAADVIIALRHPTLGETSSITLRGLAAGRPVVVNDAGWYHELPDAAVVKIPPLDEVRLEAALRQLLDHPAERARLGQAGRALIAAQHNPTHVADQYLAFLNGRLAVG